MQLLENKINDLQARFNYQWDIKKCNFLCFTESWMNNGMNNIQLVGFTVSAG
jgi:hypothetical protein